MMILTYHLVFNIVYATYYTDENSTDIFNVFKEKYNKVYKSAAEEKTRLKAFVKNLNIVDELNEVTKDAKTFFILNQYADLDPAEIEKHYAVNVIPYYNISNNEEASFVGSQMKKELNTSELYDLDNAAELYKDYLAKYNKKYQPKKLDHTIHFYRFVKTLAEHNKKYFDGQENTAIDETADIVKEPDQYFFKSAL